MLVQKQTCAGQHTRFKGFVVIRDYNGYIGLGVRCSNEVATTIHEAIIWPSSPLFPCTRLLGEQDWQAPYCPLQGDRPLQLCAGDLIPVPRGTRIISAPMPKKLLLMTGIKDS
ncbi:40S ribosomal protein S2 [Plecturocebus cupreus]